MKFAASLKSYSELYYSFTNNVSLHLKKIYKNFELDKYSITKELSVVYKAGIFLIN